ncbi:MAG: alpha/beta hydrolase family protein [bacterium]
MTRAQLRTTKSQTVVFESLGDPLCGTLEQPADSQASTAILLLSGSGPQNRNQQIAGKPTFQILSAKLARAGYAVFRWDDRGVGDSAGDYDAAGANGVLAGIKSALAQVIDTTRCQYQVLIGHSQGALFAAAMAATEPECVSGLVLAGAMGRCGEPALLDQHRRICRAQGLSEEEVKATTAIKSRLFNVLMREIRDPWTDTLSQTNQMQLTHTLRDILFDGEHAEHFSAQDQAAVRHTIDDLLNWEWRFLLGCDPAENLQRVHCPVLVCTGDKDIQVDALADVTALTQACRHLGANFSACTPRNCNHLFQHTFTAEQAYAQLGEPFCDTATTPIITWLNQNFPAL